VTVAIGGGRARALRMVEQAARHVEPNGASTRCCPSRGVRGAHPRCVDQSGGVRGQTARVPRRVAGVRTQQIHRGVRHRAGEGGGRR
jgi:hypothetical protein